MSNQKFVIANFADVFFLKAFRFDGEWWVKFSAETGRKGGQGKVKSHFFPPNTKVGIPYEG